MAKNKWAGLFKKPEYIYKEGLETYFVRSHIPDNKTLGSSIRGRSLIITRRGLLIRSVVWDVVQLKVHLVVRVLMSLSRHPQTMMPDFIFPSRISSRGNRIRAMWASVCLWALSRPNRLTYHLGFCQMMCVSIHLKKREFWTKGLYIWGTREVRERSGVFIVAILTSGQQTTNTRELKCHKSPREMAREN